MERTTPTQIFVRTAIINSVIAIAYFAVCAFLPKSMQGVPVSIATVFSLVVLAITTFIILIMGGGGIIATLYGSAVGTAKIGHLRWLRGMFLNDDEDQLGTLAKFFLFSLPFAIMSLVFMAFFH